MRRRRGGGTREGGKKEMRKRKEGRMRAEEERRGCRHEEKDGDMRKGIHMKERKNDRNRMNERGVKKEKEREREC